MERLRAEHEPGLHRHQGDQLLPGRHPRLRGQPPNARAQSHPVRMQFIFPQGVGVQSAPASAFILAGSAVRGFRKYC